jgi:hypothetical protein
MTRLVVYLHRVGEDVAADKLTDSFMPDRARILHTGRDEYHTEREPGVSTAEHANRLT